MITTEVPVPVAADARVQRLPGVEPIRITAGIRYGEGFRNFRIEDLTMKRNKLEIPVGEVARQHGIRENHSG